MINNTFPPSSLERFAPPVTLRIIIITALFWVAQQVLPRFGYDLTEHLGMHYVLSDSFAPYQLLTYLFLHSEGGLSHLFFNMFSVWMFGSTIERYWGGRRYIIYYLLTGLSAALVQQVVWHVELSPLLGYTNQVISVANEYGQTQLLTIGQWLSLHTTIGASGSVFGLLLAFGMLFPNTPLFLMFVPVPIKAKYFVVLYGLVELFYGIKPGLGDSVAHFAHLGGMLGGIVLILLWRKKGVIDGPYN